MRMKRETLLSVALLTILGGLVLLINTQHLSAQEPPPPVGPDAQSVGVVEYIAVSEQADGLHITFRHRDSSKSGTILIRTLGDTDVAYLELTRNNQIWSVTWQRALDRLIVTPPNGHAAEFNLDADMQKWISDDRGWQILEANKEQVILLGAVAVDFLTAANSSTSDSSAVGSCAGEVEDQSDSDVSIPSACSYTCDYSYAVRGWCADFTRSWACYCAHQDAAFQCTNACCWGCCDYMSEDCDCVCLEGDYWCACGISGFPCK